MSVASAKILFSHLQTVAVALRLPFQYPPFVRDLFAAMNSMSSVNTDVLALDCLLTGDAPDHESTTLSASLADALNGTRNDLEGSTDGSDSWGPKLPLDSRFIARSIVTLCIPLMLVGIAGVFWCVWPLLRAVCCAPCAAYVASLDAKRQARSSLGTSPSTRHRSRSRR